MASEVYTARRFWVRLLAFYTRFFEHRGTKLGGYKHDDKSIVDGFLKVRKNWEAMQLFPSGAQPALFDWYVDIFQILDSTLLNVNNFYLEDV